MKYNWIVMAHVKLIAFNKGTDMCKKVKAESIHTAIAESKFKYNEVISAICMDKEMRGG